MKILIVNTQSINHDNATGITLRSVFGNFEKEDLFEIYLQPCIKAEDAISLRSHHVGCSTVPIRFFANKFMKGSAISVTATSSSKTKKVSFKKRLAMLLDFEPVFLSGKLLKEIRSFSPDCIYTLGNGIDTMKLAYKISKKISVPIVPHFMDNWPASHRFGPNLFPIHLNCTQKWLKKLYSRANCGITISEKMAEEYEARWQKKHYALMNTIQVSDFKCQIDYRKKLSTFVYAGGLHLNRYKSLLDIAEALERYNAKNQGDLKLLVYTDLKSKQLYEALFAAYPSTQMFPPVDHDEIKKIYDQNDVLIHIETFDEEYREFIRYSLSTKISEYLATGKPILLYAPDDIFIYEYLKKNNVAQVVASREEIFTAIDMIAGDFDVEAYSRRSVALARKNHDIEHSNRVLHQALVHSVMKTMGGD